MCKRFVNETIGLGAKATAFIAANQCKQLNEQVT